MSTYVTCNHINLNCQIRSTECIEPNEQHCFIEQEIPLNIFRDDYVNFTSHNNDDVILVQFLPVNGVRPTIHTIPNGIFQAFPNLEILRVDGNVDSIHADDFISGEKLRELRISNELKEIGYGHFVYLNNLDFLSLADNKIDYIADQAFFNLRILALWLRNNKLTIVHRLTFDGLQVLELLDLSNNEIQTIVEGAFDLPNLKTLYLSGNKIRSVSYTLFSNTPYLQYIEMNNSTGLQHKRQVFNLKYDILNAGFTFLLMPKKVKPSNKA